jgi:SRSO17 transposase
MAHFTTWCPAGLPIETLVAVEGHRRAIEDRSKTAKSEPGLTHTEPNPGKGGTATCRW